MRSADVTWEYFGSDIVAFQRVSKQYFTLNTAAARIFELCDGTTDVSAIVQRLVKELNGAYDVVLADVQETIQGMSELGLLE
jgi:hypothetical protein